MHHKKKKTQRGWYEDTRIVGSNYSWVDTQEKKIVFGWLLGFYLFSFKFDNYLLTMK